MSGLLRGLAERAMGVAQPLRPRRASPAELAGAPSADEAAVAWPGAVPTPAVAAAPASPTPAAAPDALPIVQASAVQREPRPAEPPRQASRDVTVTTVQTPAQQRHGRHETHTTLLRERTVLREPTSLAAQPAVEPLPWVAVPPALMPPQAPQWPALPRAAAATPWQPLRAESEPAAAERPTEVHVSIGRVELIAHASAPAPRAATRARDSSRSLADYLRGGNKGAT